MFFTLHSSLAQILRKDEYLQKFSYTKCIAGFQKSRSYVKLIDELFSFCFNIRQNAKTIEYKEMMTFFFVLER